MRILVSNDDGIFAEGLHILVRSLSQFAEVIVIAPERQQSASGHGITLHKPLRMEKIPLQDAAMAFATNGTPADCVILGCLGDFPRPDLVVAGINAGANLGEEVLYSGTCAIAMEGTFQEIPSVAISVCAYTNVNYKAAERFLSSLFGRVDMSSLSLPPDTYLNINVPNLPADEVTGPVLTRLGRRKYANCLSKRQDPRGRTYYWFTGEPVEFDSGEGTDIQAIAHGSISVTPVRFRLTGELESPQIRDLMDRLEAD